MTHKEYIKYHEVITKKMQEVTKKKNADYSGWSDKDAFANFKMIEKIGVATVEQGFLTRMTDKISRIVSFVKNNELKIKEESAEDTLLDLANYCILFSGYLKTKSD